MTGIHEWLREATLTLAVGLATLFGAMPHEPSSRLALEACHLDGLAELVRCGVVEVFEDRTAGAGRRVPVHVAVVPALRRHAERDPLVLLAGGPGQGARSYAAVVDPYFTRVRRSRDVVLVDLRGTGDSAPLNCPAPPADAIPFAAFATAAADARQCLSALAGDPRHYTHVNALEDLAEVLTALGYDRVNLWGGSWGTRAALVFAARYPGRVRSVVLDGAVPLSFAFPWDYPRTAAPAFDALVRDCGRDEACRAAFRAAGGDVPGLIDRLGEAPESVMVRHPRNGRPMSFTLDAAMVSEALRALLYAPQHASLALAIMERLAAGDASAIAAAAVQSAGWSFDTMALGTTLAILCSEDVGVHQDPGGPVSPIFGGATVRFWIESCAAWPRGPRLPLARDTRLETPALILSGALDPVTPPSAGEAMRAHFPNSRHVVAPGGGHNVSFSGCMPEIIASFVERGTPEGLDAGCAAAIARPPFVVTFAGPRP